MAELSEAHRKLTQLEGSWSGTETYSHGAEDSEESESTITARLDLDGLFLIIDYVQTRDRRETFRGHGVCGWEQSRDRYVLHWFDTTAFLPASPALGEWEGDSLTFHAKSPDGRHRRYVCTPSGNAECAFRIDETTDGVTWKSRLEAELRRGR